MRPRALHVGLALLRGDELNGYIQRRTGGTYGGAAGTDESVAFEPLPLQ